MRAACNLGREILDAAHRIIRPGVTTDEIDRVVHEYTVGDAIRARTPIARFAPRSGAAQCMEDVARYVAEMPAGAGGAPVEELFARLAGVSAPGERSES